MFNVMVVFGTRPEAIKLAPVIHALRDDPRTNLRIINSGQHAQMLDQSLDALEIAPDHDLDLIRDGQSLDELTGRILARMGEVLTEESPDILIVQGDTTTMFASSLAAFYHRIPVAHVEAGLRTGIPDLPFPEEMNRRLTGVLASLHFPPTKDAAENLFREGVDRSRVFVTGNTVVDAVQWMARRTTAPPEIADLLDDPRRLIVVTAHRRESWGVPMEEIGAAIAELAGCDESIHVVFPIHPNPVVRDAIMPMIAGLTNVSIIEPLSYPAFVALMVGSSVLLTDSGGIQEEAASLGKPVLVMREVTERREGVDAGTAQLVGRTRPAIVAAVRALLEDADEYARRASAPNPYGDGRAGERIASHIVSFLEAGVLRGA